MLWEFLQPIGWKNSGEIELGSGVYESMTNGESVVSGMMGKLGTSRSLITTKEHMKMSKTKLHPVHPGEVLQEEFLKPMGLSQNRLALYLSVPARRINEIVLGKRGVTADTALRLARCFGMSAQFWFGLQLDYELDMATDELSERLEREVRVHESVHQEDRTA